MDELSADIALITESTYPYTRDDLSEWVHQLVSRLPQYRFALIFLGATPFDRRSMAYELPDNIVLLKTYYLFEATDYPKPQKKHLSDEKMSYIRQLHEDVFNQTPTSLEDAIEQINCMLRGAERLAYEDFLYAQETWDFIREKYDMHCTESSFTAYFANVRDLHKPLWIYSRLLQEFPKTRLIHSVATGYGGLLASLISHAYNIPFLLSEHGIYTKERRIEVVSHAMEENPVLLTQSVNLNYFHQMWLKFFEFIAKVCYRQANLIVSLFEEARANELEEGADESRTRIVRNGVDIERLQALRLSRDVKKFVVCDYGRVTMLKDTKTFIRAMQFVLTEADDIEAWIVGNLDDEPEYVEECRYLVKSFELLDRIQFTDQKTLESVIPEIDLIVLTSMSEGQSLVLLSALAAGIPAVTTDVGACRDVIYGVNEEEQSIGQAGEIVPVADAKSLAQAVLNLYNSPDRYQRRSEAAQKRMANYYHINQMIEAYQSIYEELMGE